MLFSAYKLKLRSTTTFNMASFSPSVSLARPDTSDFIIALN